MDTVRSWNSFCAWKAVMESVRLSMSGVGRSESSRRTPGFSFVEAVPFIAAPPFFSPRPFFSLWARKSLSSIAARPALS